MAVIFSVVLCSYGDGKMENKPDKPEPCSDGNRIILDGESRRILYFEEL